MTNAIMWKGVIIAERRAAAKRPSMPASERQVKTRRNSLSRLAHLRMSRGYATGELAAWAVAIANVIAGLGQEVTAESIDDMAKSFGLPEIERGTCNAVARSAEKERRVWSGEYRVLRGQDVGDMLAVTSVERDEAEITDIGAIDETPDQRARRLDRQRKRAARAALAAPRLTQKQRAAAEGISLATWKRRHAKSAEPKSVRSPSYKIEKIAPARVKNRTQNGSYKGGVDA